MTPSRNPLRETLGLRTSMRYAILHAPEKYEELLGMPYQEGNLPLSGAMNFIQFFATDFVEIERAFPTLKEAMDPQGMLWICWPKKSADARSKLDENAVRRIGVAHHLVDVKVCAIDEEWSGLKFVYRSKDRAHS